jgi:hypothetical protein
VGKTWVRAAFVAITAIVVAWNLIVFYSNQTGDEFMQDDKLAVRPRSLATMAQRNTMSVVNTSFYTYHSMRDRIGGAHLLIPSDVAAHRFELERVARLDVEVAPTRLELPREVAQDIFDHETNQLWAIAPGTYTGAVLEPGATRYVMVWRHGDNGLQIVLSEARYRRELDAIARKP